MESNKMVYTYREERLHEAVSLRQALNLEEAGLRGQRPIISVVGAGGKTTTLHRLADEYAKAGLPVFVTTTTHIMKEDRPWFLSGYSPEEITDCLRKFGQAWAGIPAPGGKLGILPEDALEEIRGWKIPLFMEADGARGFALKAPAEHEPVILPWTTHVLSVYGLDGVGKRIEDTVFRPEVAEILLKKKKTERVTAGDIACLAASEQAGRKGCPAGAVYTVVLNKADEEGLDKTALMICKALERKGISRVIVTGRG